MKHENKLWLIIAIIVSIGLLMTACDNGNGDQNCSTCGKLTCECQTDNPCSECGEDPCECPITSIKFTNVDVYLDNSEWDSENNIYIPSYEKIINNDYDVEFDMFYDQHGSDGFKLSDHFNSFVSKIENGKLTIDFGIPDVLFNFDEVGGWNNDRFMGAEVSDMDAKFIFFRKLFNEEGGNQSEGALAMTNGEGVYARFLYADRPFTLNTVVESWYPDFDNVFFQTGWNVVFVDDADNYDSTNTSTIKNGTLDSSFYWVLTRHW